MYDRVSVPTLVSSWHAASGEQITDRLLEWPPDVFALANALLVFFEFMDGIADSATDGNTIALPPALIQPMASDDVASEVARVAVGPPLNGIVEIAGPEVFRLDKLIRGRLTPRNDPREIISDPRARYYGIAPSERTLLPAEDARLGETRLDEWSQKATAQAAGAR